MRRLGEVLGFPPQKKRVCLGGETRIVFSAAEFESLDQILITLVFRFPEIIEKFSTPGHKTEQTAAGGNILAMGRKMLREIVDPLGHTRDLHVGTPGVSLVKLVFRPIWGCCCFGHGVLVSRASLPRKGRFKHENNGVQLIFSGSKPESGSIVEFTSIADEQCPSSELLAFFCNEGSFYGNDNHSQFRIPAGSGNAEIEA